MRYFFLLSTVCFLFFSCKKELDIESYWNCNKNQQLDSATISSKMVGSWKWTKQSCFESKTIKADKNVIASFNANGTFTVSENATVITQGSWTLEKIDTDLWELDCSPTSSYLFGRILFCGEEVLFNDSGLDGCDNLFKRIY